MRHLHRRRFRALRRPQRRGGFGPPPGDLRNAALMAAAPRTQAALALAQGIARSLSGSASHPHPGAGRFACRSICPTWSRRQGFFQNDPVATGWRYFCQPRLLPEIRRELAAQIEVVTAGRPDRLASQQPPQPAPAPQHLSAGGGLGPGVRHPCGALGPGGLAHHLGPGPGRPLAQNRPGSDLRASSVAGPKKLPGPRVSFLTTISSASSMMGA